MSIAEIEYCTLTFDGIYGLLVSMKKRIKESHGPVYRIHHAGRVEYTTDVDRAVQAAVDGMDVQRVKRRPPEAP